MSLQRSIHSGSFCLTLASSASGAERTRRARPNLPSFVRPLARGVGIPLTFTCPRSLSYARFLSVPLYGDEDSLEAWLIVGRQESAAGTSSPGIAATVSEILGYWKRSAEVGDAASKSALIARR